MTRPAFSPAGVARLSASTACAVTARRWRTLLVVLGLLAPPAAAQGNLVLNPDFTSGVATNWTAFANCPDSPGSCQAVADNVNFFGTAPSARLTSSDVGDAGQSLSSACTALSGGIAPGSTVDLGAYRRMNAGDGNSLANVDFFFTQDTGTQPCDLSQGATFTGQATISNLGETSPGSTWFLFGQTGFVIPANTTHFQVVLNVRQNVAAGNADFSFDKVFLGPPGTTPVALQSFQAE
jgi:hypothetical protein